MPPILKGFVTLRPAYEGAHGLYLLSSQWPVICRVGNTEELDAYIPPGCSFGQHRIGHPMVEYVFNYHETEVLKPRRCIMYGDRGKEIYITQAGPAFSFNCFMSKEPPISIVKNGQDELWPPIGDEVYCDMFCRWFAHSMWGPLKPLETKKVLFSGVVQTR